MTIKRGIVFLLYAAFVSFIIAVTVDMSSFGLGGFYNLFLPPMIGLISLVIYLLVCWATKWADIRITVIIILCLFDIYAGFALRFTYVPFPF